MNTFNTDLILTVPILGESARPPSLTDDEWSALEAFLACEVRDRNNAVGAFWEQTFANERGLDDTWIRLAWLGDRVVNLALADRLELAAARSRRWSATDDQAGAQSGYRAARVVLIWPDDIHRLIRTGKTWQGRRLEPSMLATYAEALVGILLREAGYEAARNFVWKWWPPSESWRLSLDDDP